MIINQPAQAFQKDCKSLNVGGATTWAPIAYLDEDTHQAEGIGYRLAQQLGGHLGIPVNLKPNLPWMQMINMVQKGELDIVAGVDSASQSQNRRFIHFTRPFFKDSLYAFVHHNSTITISRVDDLRSYKRVEVKGQSIGGRLDARLNKSTVMVNNERQRIAAIMSGKADYLLATQSEFTILKQNLFGWENVKRLPLPIKTQDVMLGVSKISPCAKHLAEINQVISNLYSIR